MEVCFLCLCYFVDSGCKDDCDLITLGTYKSVDNYEQNGGKDTVSCLFSGLIIIYNNIFLYNNYIICDYHNRYNVQIVYSAILSWGGGGSVVCGGSS